MQAVSPLIDWFQGLKFSILEYTLMRYNKYIIAQSRKKK